MGKKQEGKHRPLLVKLSNEEDRRNIILKAKNLRKTTEYRKVYIGKDMTMEERAVDKRLREELWKTRQREEGKLQIRRGRIVKSDEHHELSDDRDRLRPYGGR